MRKRSGRPTREEKRLVRYAAVARLVMVVSLVMILFLLVAVMDKPPQRNEVAETAATVAAAQEYARVLELWGDCAAAMEASNLKYEEVMAQWKP